VTLYRERLVPAPWLFIAAALVIPASVLVLAPLSLTAGVVTAVVLYAGCVLALLGRAPVIEVSDQSLSAGRAVLPIGAVSRAEPLDGRSAVEARGIRLDSRAHLVLSGSLTGLVRVTLDDPDDPTPYWLISSRHPTKLAAAIERSRRPDE
jgi:hypothetical protein